MAKGFEVSLAADARQFIAATKDVSTQLEILSDGLEAIGDSADKGAKEAEKAQDGLADSVRDAADAVEDAAKSFDKVGDEAKTAGRDIGREVEDGADKAADSVESLDKRAQSALDRLKKRAAESGRRVGQDIKDGADKAAKGFDELKDEAAQSGREAAASFSGEFEDLGDLVQEITANAFAGFGPAGMAAGIAGATGVGYIIKALTEASEEAERAKQRFQDMAEALSSGNVEDWAGYVDEQLKQIAFSSDEAVVSLDEVDKMLELMGDTALDQADIMRAFAGDSGALGEVRASLEELRQLYSSGILPDNIVTDQQLSAIERWIAKLDQTADTSERAGEAADVYKSASEESQKAITGTTEALEAQNEALQEEAELRAELAEANRSYAQILAEQDDDLAAATAAIEENNTAIADNKQRSIENIAVLADLADGLLDEAEAAERAGVQGEELSEVQQQNYRDFERLARQAGLTGDQIRELARRFGLIPDSTTATVRLQGAGDVERGVGTVRGALATIPSRVGVKIEPDTSNFIWQVKQAVRNIGTLTIPARIGAGIKTQG